MVSGAYKAAQMSALNFRPMMYMDEYLTEMDAAGKNPDYRRTVRNGLAHFAAFLRDQGLEHPQEIERVHIIRFQAHVNSNEQWSPSYRIQIMKKVRAWINWMADLEYIDSNPWQRIKVGAIQKQPKPLSDDDMQILFRAHSRDAFTMTPFTYHRRELILALLYAWGLRIHELEALSVENLDVRLDFVVAKNKGGGNKTLPYTPELKRIFARYVKHRAEYAKTGEDAALITTTGTRLAKEQIRKIITDLGKSTGVEVNPHRLRDTCGTNLLDSNVPAERVQRILGHTNLKQTLAYARVNDKTVYESAEQAMDPRLAALFSHTSDLRAP